MSTNLSMFPTEKMCLLNAQTKDIIWTYTPIHHNSKGDIISDGVLFLREDEALTMRNELKTINVSVGTMVRF